MPNDEKSVTALTHFLDELHSLDWQFLCKMQPNGYDCSNANDSLQYRWYYDVTERTCKSFSYSGCGGNENRFPTSGHCNTRCQPAVGEYKRIKTLLD
ncbi:hypothetical protein HF086_006968 [Spodoptera exigua]|uniref:BPTI/Kunitz inhibitor domain-containing protein n=1 Tax=Spodoptera exigua TaxID=7107 RepID=A0A922SHG9_SPOEX|nr:hypothetical protein HF086_006968 [Spodoptera exigua]